VGVGPLAADVAADLVQPLEVDLGDLVACVDRLQVGHLIGQFLEDLVGDLPVQGQDSRFEPGERRRFLAREFEQVDVPGVEGLVGEQGQVLEFVDTVNLDAFRFLHIPPLVGTVRNQRSHQLLLDGDDRGGY
jgi:hypothetical protein